MTLPFVGLTWDHPRGFNALAAAAGTIAPPGLIRWEKQPLEGFESHPIGELAARFDLLVLDHPHIGEAVGQDCLAPLEAVFAPGEIAAWEKQSVGPTMASYRCEGLHWALPLDVATQVMAYRPDRIGEPPHRWDEVVALSARAPVAISIAGPHATLTFFSLCIALGEEPGGEALISDTVAAEALDTMIVLRRRAPSGSAALNPIGLLDAMSTTGAIACVPLVYGYVNYASPPGNAHPLRFADAPTGPGGNRGSVLGGTGLALTKRASPDPALLAHLSWLLSVEAQCDFIPGHDGQPSARRAWQDPGVNQRSGDFYRATLATAEGAWIRPRHNGYVLFQTEAAELVRNCLDGASVRDTLVRLRAAWRQSFPQLSTNEVRP